MLTQLTRNWWVVALRGVVAILYGVLALVWPRLTIEILVLFFGAYMFVDGVFAIIAAFTNRSGYDRWWVLLLEGLVGIALGSITFLRPGLTAFALLYLIAFWAMMTGVLEIVAAIRLRKEIQGEWMLALSGVISFILGILLLLFPAAGVLTVAWMIGWYAILFGAMLLGLGWRLHQYDTHHKVTAPAT
ncbi:MAG: HdeD family acid-resistance protein [Anaerolineales bacterium]|uniref:HdeD family acid-resistance protein n=1 Tax=Candidatus Villigracilis proximus TaxID=3140683 RepID=UPI003135F2D7|nr:HdeD family acid-resistance protein [Anaerolineales bacterium]MBK8824589.1 HdeD family acid-resistance protein [Anaerolineales bacterium]MBK9210467.1 HdeD family acid-resistance protein [Anaerolineales bacterium]